MDDCWADLNTKSSDILDTFAFKEAQEDERGTCHACSCSNPVWARVRSDFPYPRVLYGMTRTSACIHGRSTVPRGNHSTNSKWDLLQLRFPQGSWSPIFYRAQECMCLDSAGTDFGNVWVTVAMRLKVCASAQLTDEGTYSLSLGPVTSLRMAIYACVSNMYSRHILLRLIGWTAVKV